MEHPPAGDDSVARVTTVSLVTHSRSTRSTIALKILMAVSGLVFIGFVLLHMYGNLKAFAGHDAYNEYADHLRTLGEPMLPHERLPLGAARRAPRRRWSCTSYCRRDAVAPGAQGPHGAST